MKRVLLSGSPEEIGFQHGKLLSEKIHQNIAFYKTLFQNNLGDETRVLNTASLFKEQIKSFDHNYITEIDHIALGAGVLESLWIYALNSRTELTLTKDPSECTAIVFPQHNRIGQTWDWSQHIEDNYVIMEICFPSGHRILQLTEAGIIGKMGLNNRGLGQTLNILWTDDRVLTGVPIHVVMRAVLESMTLKEARRAVDRSMSGKASNIIIAQSGSAIDVEFYGNETYFHNIKEETYVHTNHYLHSLQQIHMDESSYANSLARFNKASERLSNERECSIPEMISILSDQSNSEYPILRKYVQSTHKEMGYIGTLATVVMDLDKKVLMVRQGNPSSPAFSIDCFSEYQV